MIYLALKRNAFSMVTAILVIVLLSLLGGFVLSLSSSAAKQTHAQYRKEQAMALAQSYTEAAILMVLKQDMALNNCIPSFTGDITTLIPGDAAGTVANITGTGEGYHVDVNISYIGNATANFTTVNCGSLLNVNAGAQLNFSAAFATAAIPSVSIIVDVYVRYRDPLAPNVAASPWITFHRRSLQKI